MSIYARIIAAIVVLIVAAGVGFRLGIDHMKAKAMDEETVRARTIEAAQQGAAAAISKIEVKQQTIVQKVQHEVQTKTVYRDCVVPTDGVRMLNDAITGGGAAQPPGGGAVQGAASGPR